MAVSVEERTKMQMHVIASGAVQLSKYASEIYFYHRLILNDALFSHPVQILGAKHLADSDALCKFIASCQFKFGGISKTPGEHPG